MAVGFVASASSGSQASVASFNIGTLGTGARAGIVFVCIHNSATDIISGVTWNGVAMTRLFSATDTNTEPGVTIAFFLDNVTNGTITVSRTNNAVVTVGYAASISAAASRGLEVAQVKTVGGGGTVLTNADASEAGTAASGEQSLDDGSPGSNSMRFAAAFTGAATPLAQGTNSTALQSLDSTAFGSSFVRETTAGQGGRSVGFATGTTDDYAAVFVAVREQFLNVTGGQATGTGAASNASLAEGPSAGQATGTGAAGTAIVSLGPAPMAATGSGAAYTIASITQTTGPAAATGTGAAGTAIVSVGPSGPLSSGTGAAYNAAVDAVDGSPGLNVDAGVASGTGAAADGSIAFTAPAGVGTGAGSAADAKAAVGPTISAASGTGAANDATVSTASSLSVDAEVASGTGTAYNASLVIGLGPDVAAGIGAAYNAAGPDSSAPVIPPLGGPALQPPFILPPPALVVRAQTAYGMGSTGGSYVRPDYPIDDQLLGLTEITE